MPIGHITTGPEADLAISKAVAQINTQLPSNHPMRDVFIGLCMPPGRRPEYLDEMQKGLEAQMATSNAIAKAFRDNTRARRFKTPRELAKDGSISKAAMDVGTLTNFASITGGQSLGYVSLDTQLARGTVRPNSFTLYQALHKTSAYQVVDYWPTVTNTGGGLPGTAFQSYGNVSSGTLSTNNGTYILSNITLKLATDGRAMTTALAAQNSFVDIQQQETINASLNVLESENWTCYWGDPTLFTNQFQGIYPQLVAANIFDFGAFSLSYASSNGWSNSQTLFNLIYEASAQITSYRTYGRITHAFMSPTAIGALQGLVTTLLNNLVNLESTADRARAIVVDGDLQGMRTRFGEIQFPIDLFITARDKPAQAILKDDGTNYATTTSPTRPVSATPAIVASGTSQWAAPYASGSLFYSYAVASCDAAMNESTLTASLPISGVTAGNMYQITIVPPGSADASVYRVYRSGQGYSAAASGAVTTTANKYRYIGSVAANGASNVTFNDLNAKIPGSETIFLLDMDENDYAIDFRYLLPLTKIELFAQNLYMPWAVAMIGALRLRIPKFHGAIINAVVDNPTWNPLLPNTNA